MEDVREKTKAEDKGNVRVIGWASDLELWRLAPQRQSGVKRIWVFLVRNHRELVLRKIKKEFKPDRAHNKLSVDSLPYKCLPAVHPADWAPVDKQVRRRKPLDGEGVSRTGSES